MLEALECHNGNDDKDIATATQQHLSNAAS